MTNSLEIPFVRGRFLIPMVSHAIFFAAIALNLSDRAILIPVYMLVTMGLLVGLGQLESFRLSSFLMHKYPDEHEKHVKQIAAWTGYEPNAVRDLCNSFLGGLKFRFDFPRHAEDDPILKRIRQHKRWVWIEVCSTIPVMFVVLELATSVSKALRAG